MDPEEKFKKLRESFQDEDSVHMTAGMEKAFRQATLTSKLKENDAFKLLLARYAAEKQRLVGALHTNKDLFKDAEGQMLGRLIHARLEFIAEFFKIFDVAEKQAMGIMKKVDQALE